MAFRPLLRKFAIFWPKKKNARSRRPLRRRTLPYLKAFGANIWGIDSVEGTEVK